MTQRCAEMSTWRDNRYPLQIQPTPDLRRTIAPPRTQRPPAIPGPASAHHLRDPHPPTSIFPPRRGSTTPSPTMNAIEDLKRVLAAVTINLTASKAEKAALKTRISLLKRERRRLEAAFTRELAAGKPPPPIGIMQQPSLVESAASAALASDAGPHHGTGPAADTTDAGGAGSAAWSAADAPVAASRKRKRAGKAKAAAPAATAAIFEQAQTGEKPYACSMCPKTFGRKSHFVRHERTHTGDKPYACSMCPRRFGQKCHVAPHERTHTSEKPYACSMCPRRFTKKSNVAPHERTHTGEKPYACFYCGKTFAASTSARRHERTQHRGTV